MLISSISPSKNGTLTVSFEDGTELNAPYTVVAEFRLYTGKDVDEVLYQEVLAAKSTANIRETALGIIGRRHVSKKELSERLSAKGYEETAVSQCISWLEDKSLINDASYACAIARHYSGKGYGKEKIKSELYRRGIDKQLWSDALTEASTDFDRLQSFIASRLSDPEDKKQIQKVTMALSRRGFSYSEIKEALSGFSADFYCEDDL